MPQIIPIKELKNTSEISEMCHRTEEPIYITKNGYGDMLELIEICRSDDNIPEPVKKERCIYQIGEAHIAIGVDNIEQIKEKICLYGGQLLTDILIKGERKCCFCRDPEGNFIELIE